MTAVERIAAQAVARVRARLMALPEASARDDDVVLRGSRSWLRWPAGLLR